jgi:hypothetical protein
MLYKSREIIKRQWFNSWCRGILATSPVHIPDTGLIILSKVCHMDLIMYLLAVKSLLLYLREGKIVVLNDGTLTSEDKAILKSHLSPHEVVHVNDITYSPGSRGPNWDILLHISDYAPDSYVIQLDSDTLTLEEIPEVIDCIKQNRSFSLGTAMGRAIVSMEEFCKSIKEIDGDHVQLVAEQNFDKLHNYRTAKYVRGCAGFTGFARGSFTRTRAEEFFEEMKRAIDTVWLRRGSFQVASNFMIANSPEAQVLPYPKYSNFNPGSPYEDSSFLHFIGPTRFAEGVYVRKGRTVVKKITSASLAAGRRPEASLPI